MMRSTLWILCVGWAFIPAAGLRAEDKPAELRSIKVAANDWPWWRGPSHNGIAPLRYGRIM